MTGAERHRGFDAFQVKKSGDDDVTARRGEWGLGCLLFGLRIVGGNWSASAWQQSRSDEEGSFACLTRARGDAWPGTGRAARRILRGDEASASPLSDALNGRRAFQAKSPWQSVAKPEVWIRRAASILELKISITMV